MSIIHEYYMDAALNCVYDRWAQNVAGPPVIQPKAGAVKAPELSPYYSIYI